MLTPLPIVKAVTIVFIYIVSEIFMICKNQLQKLVLTTEIVST